MTDTKVKHTASPWKAEYSPEEVEMGWHKREWQVIGQLEGFGTAQHVASCYSFPQSEANARLIASAPELLEACKEAYLFFSGSQAHKGLEIIEDMLNNALAKAKRTNKK